MQNERDLAYEEKLKSSRRRALIMTITSSILTCGLGFGIGLNLGKSNVVNVSKEMGTFLNYYNMFKNNYYLEVDERTLIDGLYYGLTSSVDDQFTFYVSSKNNESQGLSTSQVGIGFERSVYYGNALLTHVMNFSPASKARFLDDNNNYTDEEPGLKDGDIITKVRDFDSLDDYFVLKDHSSSSWNEHIVGQEGTNIEIVILRDGIEKRCVVKRGKFDSDKVRLIEKNYSSSKKEAIVKVSSFLGNVSSNESTPARELIDLFKDNLFKDNDKIDNLVLDLRDNGGGYVVNFSELLSLFTGKLDAFGYYYYPKTNTYSKVEAPSENGITSIYKYDGWKNYNSQIGQYTILINENTASAAESFVLGMKDYKDTKNKVVVVGETSYGKGIAQSFYYPFNKDYDFTSSIRYTSAEVVSMEKNSINKRGIVPDIFANDSDLSIQDKEIYDLWRKEVTSISEGKDQAIVLSRIQLLLDKDFGNNLVDAIKEYQKSKDLTVNGLFNKETSKSLNDDFFDYYHLNSPYNLYTTFVEGNDDIDSFSSPARRVVKKQIELVTGNTYEDFYSACINFQTIYASELGEQEKAYNIPTAYLLQGKLYDLNTIRKNNVLNKAK